MERYEADGNRFTNTDTDLCEKWHIIIKVVTREYQ